ncbi:transmembrane protein 138 isoform X1 [Patagioenas fasciata]|uniref:transmembrane protein 138 isoform X1 n=1 Tax=Patagioenas fasciata TaxID=372321 RepID=UPI003A993E91
MLQTSNYSLVLFLQFLLLFYDLFVNSFSELLRVAPAVQLVLFIIQDITILFNVIIIFLMFFNTFVFQAGLVNLLFHKFKGTILLSAAYLALSIAFHVWMMNLRWRDSSRFVWTEGLQTLFVFQRLADGGAPGRPPLLPRLTLAAQRICPFPRLTAPLGFWGTHHLSPRLPGNLQRPSAPLRSLWGRLQPCHLPLGEHRRSSCGCWGSVGGSIPVPQRLLGLECFSKK